MCQIYDHSGKETGFRDTEQETSPVELCGTVDEASQNRNYAPGNHDGRNPLPRAPAFDDEVPGISNKT